MYGFLKSKLIYPVKRKLEVKAFALSRKENQGEKG